MNITNHSLKKYIHRLEVQNKESFKKLHRLEERNTQLYFLIEIEQAKILSLNNRQCGKSSALDRIHIRRLMIYTEKLVKAYARNTQT